LLGLVIVATLFAASCGGEGDDASGDVATTTRPDQSSPSSDDGEPDQPVEVTTTTEPVQGVVEPPDLGDTSWLVDDYRLPDGGITNTWLVDVTIAFSADGTVSGSAGCNDYQGTWSAAGPYEEAGTSSGGQGLVFGSLTWTEMACEDERIMTQEEEILDVLQKTGRWVLLEGDLNLLDSEGKYLANASSTGIHPLAGRPCAGDPTKIDIGVPFDGRIEMAGDWPEVRYFCVEIPGDVSTLTVALSGMTADLGVYVGYPDLEILTGGLAGWSSDEFDTEDEVVVISPELTDSVSPGAYYIEVSSYVLSDEPVSSPFTLTVTTG
jgi:heat shock protein HslJ